MIEEARQGLTDKKSIKLDVQCWHNEPSGSKIIKSLVEKIGKPKNISSRAIKNAMAVLVANLFTAYQANPVLYVAYSRKDNTYKASSRYNPLSIARKPLVYCIDGLAALDLVENYKGFYYGNQDKRNRIARVRAKPALMLQFAQLEGSFFEKHPESEIIILKDSDKNKIEYGKSEKTSWGIVRKDPPNVIAMRKKLHSVNKLYKDSHLSLDIPEDKVVSAIHEINEVRSKAGKPIIDLSQRQLHRVFNDGKFNIGGRFYGGWWQNCPKELRPLILINGERTVEKDYKALHPSLIYLKETGALPDGDPYEIPDYEGCLILRKFMKQATLSMMNAPTFEKGLGAARSELTKSNDFSDDDKKYIRSIGVKQLLDLHKTAHPIFWKYMGKDMGKKLQYLDSKIAESVLTELTKKRICCLPVHDSFIVSRNHLKTLIQTMRHSFLKFYDAYPLIT